MIVLAVTVFVYVHFKELSTVPAKCAKYFVVGLMVTYIFLPMIHYHTTAYIQVPCAVILIAGFLFTYLWMSVLSFDIWWTFRLVGDND